MAHPPNTPWQPPGPPPPGPPGPPPPGAPGGWGGPPPRPRKNRTGLILGLVAGGLVVVAVAALAVMVLVVPCGDDGGCEDSTASGPLTTGAIAGGAQAVPGRDGSLTMVKPGVEGPVVEVFEDFACPHCGTFDRMVDPMLKKLVVGGKAKVVFRPMVVFGKGREPMYGNSLRAASALRCVRDGAQWLKYQDALFQHQPKEHEKGYPHAALVSYGQPMGLVDDAFSACVGKQEKSADVLATSRTYVDSGVSGTPGVRVNGRMLPAGSLNDVNAIRRAIESAA